MSESEKAKQQFIKMWQAKRTLRLLDMLTDAQQHSIHNKLAAFRKKHDFVVSIDELDSDIDELDSDLQQSQPAAMTEEQMEQELKNKTELEDRLVIYNELIAHLGLNIYESAGEKEQGEIIALQIKILAKKCEDNFYNKTTPNP